MQITGESTQINDLYGRFSADGVHDKPMVITETSAMWLPSITVGVSDLQIKQTWWTQVRQAPCCVLQALRQVSRMTCVQCRYSTRRVTTRTLLMYLCTSLRKLLLGCWICIYQCPLSIGPSLQDQDDPLV